MTSPDQIKGCEEHAWIRDNVYSVMAVWALAMAYRWEIINVLYT